MKAAVVERFGEVPAFREFSEPTTTGAHDEVITVVAAGLHPRVRSQADGSHYTSTDELPLIPGIDGVGRDSKGRLRYFVLPDTTRGSMAERTAIDLRRSIELPDDVDPFMIAAAMNPGMSSWVALRRRIAFVSGQRVLILGATGNAGRMAVQIAKQLGAGSVVAAGRNADQLARLREHGADTTVCLNDEPGAVAARLGDACRRVDVVLDYVWGQPTADAMRAIVPERDDDSQRLTWVQIGSMAGLASPIPSAALRATRLEIVGSGQGSVSTREILDELPNLVAAVKGGMLAINARSWPLSDVAGAWSADVATTDERIVVTP